MTPIRCLRVRQTVAGWEIYTEDYAGNKNLVASSPNVAAHQWLVDSLTGYHKVSVMQWDEEVVR